MNRFWHFQILVDNKPVFDSQKEKGLKGYGNRFRADRDAKNMGPLLYERYPHLDGIKANISVFEVMWEDLPDDHPALMINTEHINQ